MNRIPLFALALLGAALSGSAYGEFFSYTGKYKVHNDKCYNQIDSDSTGLRWEEHDCVSSMKNELLFLEVLGTHRAILVGVENQYKRMKKGLLTKEQYHEIVERAMFWMRTQPDSREMNNQILKHFNDDAVRILKGASKNSFPNPDFIRKMNFFGGR